MNPIDYIEGAVKRVGEGTEEIASRFASPETVSNLGVLSKSVKT